jgi:hypothetical protein
MEDQENTSIVTPIEVNLPPSYMENPIKSPIKTQSDTRRQDLGMTLP